MKVIFIRFCFHSLCYINAALISHVAHYASTFRLFKTEYNQIIFELLLIRQYSLPQSIHDYPIILAVSVNYQEVSENLSKSYYRYSVIQAIA